MEKSKITFIISSVILLFVLAGIIIYKHIFEYDNKEVDRLLMEKASKYENKEAAFKILRESAKSILNNRHYTRQIKIMSQTTGLPIENSLADAALAHSQSEKYLI